MQFPIVRVIVLSLGLSTALANAEDLPCRRDASAGDRPRIGLVLGGGGARGFAHISVIKELERLHVPVDCIAGTSAGSLVGGMYASGMSAAQIEALVISLDWTRELNDSLARPERSFSRKRDDELSLLTISAGVSAQGVKLAPGVLAGERVQLLFQRLTQPVANIKDFNKLPIPFRAVATDANTGKAVVLQQGNLADAMRASMSIPALFRPVLLDGKVLIDGGMADQVPVDVARAMGADIIIAVDVGTPLAKLGEDASLIEFAGQMTGFLTVRNTQESVASLGPRDLLIRPEFGDEVSTGDFAKVAESIAIGATAVSLVTDKLAAMGEPETSYQRQFTAQIRRDVTPPVISFVRLDNQSAYSEALLLARLDLPLGQPLDVNRLESKILRIYALDTLDKITYEVVEDGGKTGLMVSVKPHTYGPNYLETGLNFYTSYSGDFVLNLRAGVLRAPINALGGEVRLLAQFGSEPGFLAQIYQPLDIRGRYFVGSKLVYASPLLTLFDGDGNQVSTYEVPTTSFDLYGGREFGNYGAFVLGWTRGSGEANVVVGSPNIPESKFEIGEARWSLTVDRLDSAYLPRNGYFASLGGTYSRGGLGADADFDQIDLDSAYARLIGTHSGFVGFRYHQTTQGEAPFQSQYRLGGVTRFAGYRPNELVTPNYAIGYAGYTHELGSVLNRPTILGGTIEYGSIWQDGSLSSNNDWELNASVYLGFDSWLGRLLLGYGYSEQGPSTFFMELGQTR